jgi:hypothetical protein
MTCVASVALALLFTFASGTLLHVILAIDLIGGWTLAVFTVVLLLAAPSVKGFQVVGRILVWLSLVALLLAGGLGALAVAGTG